jgi:hypothetical protein
MCMMTCCALGDQDAILGHVASRGDRFPRACTKPLGPRPVNAVLSTRALCVKRRHEQFNASDGTFRERESDDQHDAGDEQQRQNDFPEGRFVDASE